jgi:hypothetical protein
MRTWAGTEDGGDEEQAGTLSTTVVLTADGWEDADYVEPGDDWRLLADGSYLSLDGTLRSWPLAGPTET